LIPPINPVTAYLCVSRLRTKKKRGKRPEREFHRGRGERREGGGGEIVPRHYFLFPARRQRSAEEGKRERKRKSLLKAGFLYPRQPEGRRIKDEKKGGREKKEKKRYGPP